jgi:hypothetical protein
VAVLELLAKALRVEIGEFFIVPKPGEKPPATLPSGRKRQSPP